MPGQEDEPTPEGTQREPPGRLALTRGRDRPRERDGSSEVEEQIFAATETLLAEIGLTELGVSEICRRTGIARGTFYFYFSSKYAVLTGLVARVMDAIFQELTPFARGVENATPAQTLAAGLRAGWRIWQEHRVLLRATSEHWAEVPELRELWLAIMERFTDAIAGEIDRERAAGIASPGIDSRRLASLLLWSAERHAYVAGLGLDPELPDEESIFDAVLELWLRAIYAEIPAGIRPG